MEQIQPIQSLFRRSQSNIRLMISAKIIMGMFAFTVNIQRITNLNIKVSAIGLTLLLLYFVLLTVRYRRNCIQEPYFDMNGHVGIVMILVTLAIDLPCITMLHLGFWMLFLVPRLMDKLRKYKNETLEQGELVTTSFLVFSSIYHQLIMLKYEQIIDLEWNFVLFGVCLLAFIWFLYLCLWLFIYLVMPSQLLEDNESEDSYQQQIKVANSAIVFVLVTFLTFLCYFVDHYISEQKFESLLYFTQIAILYQVIIYGIFTKALIIYLNPDLFKDRLMLKIGRHLQHKD